MFRTWLKLPDVRFELAAGLAVIARILTGDKGAMIGQGGQ